MAEIIQFDDEAAPTKKRKPVLTGIPKEELKQKVNNYRTYISEGRGTNSGSVVLATTITLATVLEILEVNPGSVGIRIYLYKESPDDEGADARFMITPVWENTAECKNVINGAELYSDERVTDTSGVVFLTYCPKPACPPPPPGNEYSFL